MKNYLPTNIARILFGLTMAFFGFGHMTNAAQMSGMIQGWPMATALIYISGAALMLAAVSFIINKQVKLAGNLLALMLLIIAFGVHAANLATATEEMMKMMSMTSLIKDLGIAMGAVAFANSSES